MSKIVSSIKHEETGAAYEVRARNGVVMAKGSIARPAIYDTLPAPHRPIKRAFLERLCLARGEWLTAEKPLQVGSVATLLNRARSLPGHLRVVVLNWAGARVEVDTASAVVSPDGAWLRPGARRKALALTQNAAAILMQPMPVSLKHAARAAYAVGVCAAPTDTESAPARSRGKRQTYREAAQDVNALMTARRKARHPSWAPEVVEAAWLRCTSRDTDSLRLAVARVKTRATALGLALRRAALVA